MSAAYPLDQIPTSIKLRDGLRAHSGHCAYCATRLGKLPAAVVVIDGQGPLCGRCAAFSPLGALARGLVDALSGDDAVEVIVELWRCVARDYFRFRQDECPADLRSLVEQLAGDDAVPDEPAEAYGPLPDLSLFLPQ